MDNFDIGKLPRSVSDFEQLRKLNRIYVDKTDLIYKFVSDIDPVFLSRPRRFGKSLLTTTIKSLFEHGLEYFEGLKINKLWKDDTYPVLYLNFSDFGESDYDFFFDSFLTEIKYFIQNNNIKIDVNIDSIAHPVKLFKKAVIFSEKPIVILIDEYDCQLTHNLNNSELYEKFRSLISTFFLSIKANLGKIRFMFITGVTRHTNTNIISGFNNLKDISTNPDYGTILGFTEEEIDSYFTPFIENAAKELNTTIDEIKIQLKNHYDGYCFDEQLQNHVYNPWSLVNFFENPKLGFKSYWIFSGFPSLVIEYFKSEAKIKNNLDLFKILNKTFQLSDDEISNRIDIKDSTPESILYQSGFITLSKKNPMGFEAKIPNFEVRQALSSRFFTILKNDTTIFNDNLNYRFVDLITTGFEELDIFKIMEGFQSIINNFRPGTDLFNKEVNICDAIKALLNFAPVTIKKEDPENLGKPDITIYYKGNRYLFEFKVARNDDDKELLDEAINQVISKQYGLNTEPGKLFRFAVVFNLKKRLFTLGEQIKD